MGQALEVTLDTSVTPTPANDPSKPAEGSPIPGGVQINAPAPKPTAEKPKAEEKPAASPKVETERPAWLPEKYKTPEEFAKAHAELEKKLGAPPKKDDKKDTSPEPLDLQGYAAEYAKDGKLSDKTLEALSAKGIPVEIVTRFVEGQKALAESQTRTMAEVVGGAEALTEVLQWSGKNLSKAEIDGYNALIDAGNLDAAKTLLSSFHARFTEANGQDPALVINAGSAPGSGTEPAFASAAEMVRAIQDKRYSEDPAYRKSVERRIAKMK